MSTPPTRPERPPIRPFYLSTGSHNGDRFEAPPGPEPPTVCVEAFRLGEHVAETYRLTRQHSFDGCRIYVLEGAIWPEFMTLGWVGPIGVKAESDPDPEGAAWLVRLAGFGSAITLRVWPAELPTARHFDRLNAAANRLIRGAAPRGAAAAASAGTGTGKGSHAGARAAPSGGGGARGRPG